MKTSVQIKYVEEYIPPRCRKPRYKDCTATIPVNIREADPKQVSTAFIVKEFQHESVKVILYRGCLYRQYQYRDYNYYPDDNDSKKPLFINQVFGTTNWNRILRDYSAESCSNENYIKKIRKKATKFLVVGNDVYVRCSIPYYSVTTFGLGRNHGGTGLFVSWAHPKERKVYGWTPADTQSAIEGAVKVALNRGDTDSESYIRKGGNGSIETLMPEVINKIFDNPDARY